MLVVNTLLVAVATLLSNGFAKEMAVNEVKSQELYQSGVMMERIMMKKEAVWDRQRANGQMNSAAYPEINRLVPCVNGLATAVPGNANQTFRCSSIDLLHFKSHADLGSKTGEGSSSWGWTSPEGREFVALGQADGAAFVEINKEGKMLYLGRLPNTPGSQPAIWREIRAYKNYVVIGSESDKHGIQIFDMTKLLTVDPAKPVTFHGRNDLTGLFNKLPIGRTHNVVVNEAADMIYSVGAVPRNDTCRSGIIMISVKDPANPTQVGCAWQDGYVHDAQCLIYKGPDTKYVGREICYGYNEDTLTIYDTTDKTTPKILSRVSYEGASYTHQGWVLDPNWQEYLVMDDEYDEVEQEGPAKDGHPVTYIWNIASLENPKQTGYYKSPAYSIDHNQYIANGFAYQSNYGSGFRILDVSSIPTDPTGKGVKEVGFFDIYPEDDALPKGGVIQFVGSWSSYALFKSGHIFVNSIERGAFVLKRNTNPAAIAPAAPAQPAVQAEEEEDDEERRSWGW